MTRKNRLIALTVALTVIFVMLFNICFIAAETDHDCVGEDCPICCQISVCENTLRAVGTVVLAAIFSGFLVSPVPVRFSSAKKQSYHFSLVSLKVKLSD